jgi:SAM-dependent methyltransferase
VKDEAASWRFDEMAHAGAEHLDPAYVAAYDEKAGSDWDDDVAVLLANGVGPASTVVDLGAGTGTFALAIAPHVKRVVGVDVSPPMVQLMRARGVEAVHGGFLTYEHEGDPPDAVVTRNALHSLPDNWKVVALERIPRMLTPGGLLYLRDLVYSFSVEYADATMKAWFAAAPTDPAEGWTADELATHVREEFSTFTWLLEPMLEHAGFEIRERSLDASGFYAAYTCRRA